MVMPNNERDAERSKLAAAATVLTAQVDLLTKNLRISQEQLTKVRRLTRIQTIVVLLLALVLAVMGFLFGAVHKQGSNNKNTVACISTWATATTKRANTLTKLSSTRTDALDSLVRTLSLPQDQLKAQFSTQLHAYLTASDAYRTALRKNPVPPSPKFNCK